MNRSGYMEIIVPWDKTCGYPKGKLVSHNNAVYRTKCHIVLSYYKEPGNEGYGEEFKSLEQYEFIDNLPQPKGKVMTQTQHKDFCLCMTSNVIWKKRGNSWVGKTEAGIKYQIVSWQSSERGNHIKYELRFKVNKKWTILPASFYELSGAKDYAEYHYRWAIT